METRNSTLLVLIILLSLNSSAQFKNPSPSAASEFKNRKTLYVEDFLDTDEQKEWLKKHWMFDHEIKFISTNEMKAMAKKEEGGSLIMSGRVRAEAFVAVGAIETNDKTTEKEAFVMAIYLSESAKTCYDYQIESRKKKEVVKLSTVGQPQSEAGMLYLCQHFYNLISNASGHLKNADRTKIPSEFTLELKNKTIYIPDYLTKASISELKSKGKLDNIEIVDFETLNKAILNKDPNVAYCNLIFSDKQINMGLMVINAADGRPMVDAGVGGVSIGLAIPLPGETRTVLHPIGKFSIKGSHIWAINWYINKAAKRVAKGK